MADAEVSQFQQSQSLPQLEPRRACQECNRKKTKCDMRRPVCGLCLRTGNSCTFPSKRKKPVARKPQLKTQSRKISDSLSKLVHVLEAASRAGEDIDTQDGSETSTTSGRRGIPQSLLRDSLKDLLVEINSSDEPSTEPIEPAEDHGNENTSASDEEEFDEEGPEADDPEVGDPNPIDSTDANTKLNTPPVVSGSGGEITSSLAVDLINLFFEKVQPWLPLLHRPRFQSQFENLLLVDGDVMTKFSVDEALLLYGMFAMSARFSNHPRFATIRARDRGHVFAERARKVYTQARSLRNPTLTYLQGCILLAFYFYTSGPTHQGWILIGVCVRLAYDLGLSEIDDEDWAPPSPVDAVEKEEMRRSWWLVWELDAFASTVSRNPFSIDRKRMAVNLPISDEAWFAEIEIQSSELVLVPGQSWRSLQGSSNQDERAWFLVANNFMATIHDRMQQRHDVTADEKLTLENEVCCFKLALPPSLRLDADTLTFTPQTFTRCNWVIGTHLMLMAASFMVSGITTTENDDRSVSSMGGGVGSPLRQRAIDLSRIISLWDSRYIAVAHPFFTCMMLPPYAVDGDILRTQPLISSSHDLAKLVLAHVAEKWKLGSVVSELAKMLERGSGLNAEEKQLAKRYAVFFRIPRLTSNSPSYLPPESGRRGRHSSSISDGLPYTSRLELSIQQQQQPPPPQQQQHIVSQDEFAAPVTMSDQAGVSNYPASMFDPQNFPPLQPTVYDGSNDLDFGFSDFFGNYRDFDLMLNGSMGMSG